MRRAGAVVTAVTLLCGACAFAASTTTWEMNSYQDFVRGRFSGISLDRDGRLTVAPAVSAVFTSSQPVIWSVAPGPQGTVYAGTGHGGMVYEVPPSGRARLLWKAEQPEVFALAVNSAGVLYAATSPDGKVFRIEGGKATEFFDPHAKYIWSLAFGPDGALFVGTGGQGEIYRVDAQGNGSKYYSTGQSHVTSLAVDAQGRLLAGTEPNGILYRVTAKDKAFVLYDSTLPEIRALAQGPDGSVYAAAMGGSVSSRAGVSSATVPATAATGSTPSVSVTVTDSTSAGSGPTDAAPDLKPKIPTPVNTPAINQAANALSPILEVAGVEKSAVYRIHPDNTVETLWSSKDENIYDLAVAGDDLLLATDLQGRLYRLSTDRKTWLIAQTGEGEITRLLPSGEGLLAATGDMGKLFRIGQAPAATGSYEAPVHDTATVARWGRLMWRMGDGGGTVRFETRSGNSARPDNTWSEWSEARNGAIASPNARFLQWRVELQGHASLEGVTVAYLPQNTPPAVRSILVSSAGPAAPTASKAAASASSSASYSITVTDTGETPSLSSGTPSQTVGRTGGGQIQVSWQADDPDGDKLVYALYFRGEGEQTWKLLKDNLGENVYNIDGDALADGRYFFRVVASDRPSNPPGLARATDLESSPVLIDNTPPMVKITAARREGNQAEIDIEAADAASPLKRCEYSVDAGPWTLVEAADGITDSPREQFLIRAAGLTEGEHLVVIRVYDSVGNAGLVKTVLK